MFAVQAKLSGRVISIAEEMRAHSLTDEVVVVQQDARDGLTTQRIKRVIDKMTKYRSDERMTVGKVEKKLKGITIVCKK